MRLTDLLPGVPPEAAQARANELANLDPRVVKLIERVEHLEAEVLRLRRELDLLRISRKLHSKNSQFDVALNNMIQGLCMFDGEQRRVGMQSGDAAGMAGIDRAQVGEGLGAA